MYIGSLLDDCKHASKEPIYGLFCANCSVVSPTLNVIPTLFVMPCNCYGGSQIYNVAVIVTYQMIFQNSIIHDNIFHHKVLTREGKGLNSSIIHDSNCSLIHNKCHPKCYNSDIKYHMTLNIMFSVVCVIVVNFPITLLMIKFTKIVISTYFQFIYFWYILHCNKYVTTYCHK